MNFIKFISEKFAVFLLLLFCFSFDLYSQDYHLTDYSKSSFFLGQFDLNRNDVSDLWGYYDAATGKEYALVGYGLFNTPPNAGLSIIDVTDPANPFEVANLNQVPGFDVKVWQHYVYTVNGNDNPGAIIDILKPEQPEIVGAIDGAHNIFIDDYGLLYLECPGLRIYDLNQDPLSPVLIFSDNDNDNACHDASVIGNRLYDFHGYAGTNIYQIDRDSLSFELIGSVTDPLVIYHHSGWPTEDGKFLFICDELADISSVPADITIWDISNVNQPQKVAEIADPNATVHNIYIVKKFAYVSYYNAGFKIYDVSDPRKPVLAGEYDTNPGISGPGFSGAFGVYPFAGSEIIYVSDVNNGLFLFSSLATDIVIVPAEIPQQFELFHNFPNPFNHTTKIHFFLNLPSQVLISIYNVHGQLVNKFKRSYNKGYQFVNWNGTDQNGNKTANGIYIYTLQSDNFLQSKTMIKLR